MPSVGILVGGRGVPRGRDADVVVAVVIPVVVDVEPVVVEVADIDTVAVLPMSILDIQSRVDRSLFCFKDDPWYKKQAFAKDKGQARWALVDTGIVANSTSKTWQEQQALLDEGDETPTARVMVYTIILNYLVMCDRLLKNVYARISDLDSVGRRVFVGSFGDSGLDVNAYWDAGRHGDLGVSSSRKS